MITVSKVTNSQSFGAWLERTNQMASLFTSNTVTTDATSGGSLTSGNAYISGSFGANYLVVNTGLIGGNVSSNSSIPILSNTFFKYDSANILIVTSNSTYTNVHITPNNVYISPTSNTLVSGSVLNINATTTNVTSTSFNANTVSTLTGNTTVKANTSYTALSITGNSSAVIINANSSNTTVTGNAYFSNTLAVTGATTLSNTLSVTGNTTLSNTLLVTGNTTLSNTLVVTGNVSLSNTLSVAGTANISGAVSIGGDFIPFANITYNIGNNTLRWNELYISNVTASYITVSGNSNFDSGTLFIDAVNNRVGLSNTTPDATLTVTGTANISGASRFGGITTLAANLVISTTAGISANGGYGTAGQLLASNASSVYWLTPLSSVATGNGLTGGTITTTGTVSVLANSGIVANSTGVFVLANSGIVSNSTGVFVLANSGIVSNSTGVFVNTSYISTLSANNASYLNGQAAAYYTNATNITTGTLPYTQLGTNVVNTTANFTISGIHTHSGNTTFSNWADFKTMVESVSAPTISASTLTLDLSNSTIFNVNLNSSITTLTISNAPSTSNKATGFILILTADGTARTISWPASVYWPNGLAPTITSTNNKRDIITMFTTDNGTSYNAFITGQNI